MTRYNGAVNGYFICDRGRFGYEFVNDNKRIKSPQIRSKKDNSPDPVPEEQLIPTLNRLLSKNKNIIGVGSPRASLESNFALMTLVGKENFYHGISVKEFLLTRRVTDFLQHISVHTASLKQVEKADAIIVLGEDLTNSAPMIALALRQAARNRSNEEARKKGIPLWNDLPVREHAQDSKSPVFIATPFSDSLDEVAELSFRGSYQDISELGSAIALKLDNKAPETHSDRKDLQNTAEKIAKSLKDAKNPLIISGISCNDENLVHAALNIASALLSAGSDVMLNMVFPECNSMGLSLFPGKPFEETLQLAEQKIDTLIVLENDLYRRAEEDSVNDLFKKCSTVIVLDHLVNKTTQKADLLFPAATFAESEGTLVNNEGRAQRFYKAINIKDGLKESWRWIAEFISSIDANHAVPWERLDDIVETMAIDLPLFSKIRNYIPDADFRMINAKIPRQTIRYSGRTAMNANIAVSEAKLPEDRDSPLAFSMEGQPENPPSSLVPFYWMPGWNSVQAMYNYLDEPDESMKGGDPGIRLIEPVEGIKNIYFRQGSHITGVRKNEWLIVPVYQIFGSEELSSLSPSVAQRIQDPFVLMNKQDAEELGLKEGDFAELEILKIKLRVKVKTRGNSISRLAGLSVNMPDMPFIDVPCTGKFHKL
jgi:NADH-quinone oxidoreductase subunit G